MTGRFETLIYTDCRSGQGLEGTAGFQFQACSPGTDARAMKLVQRNLLYEPPTRWMRERRPVADYPPSFAHVWDGLLATAAGVYLGKESVGGREGNQLTHSIVTKDPTSYGQVRPAQLFGASFWTTGPAPTIRCPAVEPGWRPGPFGATEAQEFVRTQPAGGELLRALLSELQRDRGDHGRRVLFVARDPAAVLRWVTAATLLLPQREALEIGFKIFTLNPAFAPQQILAVHPDWAVAGANIDNDQGYAVFDLVRHAWKPVEPTAAARLWTDLFLNEDPYDVIDAVEVAAAAGLRSADATAVALAAVLGRAPDRRSVPNVVSWLGDRQQPLVRRYGAAIIDLLVDDARDVPAQVLLNLDKVSRESPFLDRAATVRLALIRAELRDAQATLLVRTEPVAPMDRGGWGPDQAARAARMCVEALRPAAPAQFEVVLRVARRFGVAVPLREAEPGLRRFIRDWAGNPGHPYRPEFWPEADQLDAMLREELGQRLKADPAGAEELGDQWWELLLREPMRLDTLLDAAVVSAALRHLPKPQRLDLVRQCLHEAKEGPDPTEGLRRTAAVLWMRSPPTPDEVGVLRGVLPRGFLLEGRVFAVLAQRLVSKPIPVREDVEAGFDLVEHGLWEPEPAVDWIISADLAFRTICVDLEREGVDLGRLAVSLSRVPAQLLEPRLESLTEAMLRARVAVATLTVLGQAPQVTPVFAARLLRQILGGNWRPPDMATAFALANPSLLPAEVQHHLPPGLPPDLDRHVRVWMSRCSQRRLEQVSAQITQLGPRWVDLWVAVLRVVRRRGPLSWLPRRER